MQFYELRSDIGQIGNIPQLILEDLYQKDGERSIYKISQKNFLEPINFTPEFSFVVNKTSFLTDILDCFPLNGNTYGLLCNKNVISILREFNLPNNFIYNDVKIYDEYKQLNTDYYWIHFMITMNKFIDFQRSNFILTNHSKSKRQEIFINSIEDFLSMKGQRKGIVDIEKLVFTISTNLDVFRLGNINNKLYFSESLIRKLIKENVTGVEYIKGPVVSYP